jgi:hypothetical protein
MAVTVTLVEAKKIRISVHNQNNTNNRVQTTQNTVNTSTHITKTPSHYKSHTYTHTHTLQDKLKQTQYKIYPNEIVTIQSSTLSIRSP